MRMRGCRQRQHAVNAEITNPLPRKHRSNTGLGDNGLDEIKPLTKGTVMNLQSVRSTTRRNRSARSAVWLAAAILGVVSGTQLTAADAVVTEGQFTASAAKCLELRQGRPGDVLVPCVTWFCWPKSFWQPVYGTDRETRQLMHRHPLSAEGHTEPSRGVSATCA
jgi:hypothetical protein